MNFFLLLDPTKPKENSHLKPFDVFFCAIKLLDLNKLMKKRIVVVKIKNIFLKQLSHDGNNCVHIYSSEPVSGDSFD